MTTRIAFASSSAAEADDDDDARNVRRSSSRREVLFKSTSLFATTAAFALTTNAKPAFAVGAAKRTSVEEKELAKEQRKAALRAAAERAAQTGVGGSAFSDSEYMVGEDHTPNAHSHQEEGSKGSFV